MRIVRKVKVVVDTPVVLLNKVKPTAQVEEARTLAPVASKVFFSLKRRYFVYLFLESGYDRSSESGGYGDSNNNDSSYEINKPDRRKQGRKATCVPYFGLF